MTFKGLNQHSLMILQVFKGCLQQNLGRYQHLKLSSLSFFFFSLARKSIVNGLMKNVHNKNSTLVPAALL